MIIKDTKPQVGIFEEVEGVLLIDTEDVQTFSESGEYFDGNSPHLHAQSIKTLVEHDSNISDRTKIFFRTHSNAYLNYPRGRVDYNTRTHKYHIMSSRKYLTVENVEKITRAFHLPPYASGNIVLEADEGHYSY